MESTGSTPAEEDDASADDLGPEGAPIAGDAADEAVPEGVEDLLVDFEDEDDGSPDRTVTLNDPAAESRADPVLGVDYEEVIEDPVVDAPAPADHEVDFEEPAFEIYEEASLEEEALEEFPRSSVVSGERRPTQRGDRPVAARPAKAGSSARSPSSSWDRPPPARRGSPERQRSSKLVPALSIALMFTLALAAVLGAKTLVETDASSSEVADFMKEQTPRVARSATEVATLLMNYDSTNLEEVSADLLSRSTGNFREDYEDVLSGGLSDALKEASASSRGQILEGPDIFFREPSEAIAIIRLSQTTQSTENPEGQSFIYVMKITMLETKEGGWKADRIEILSQERA
ncbi:MAG TPA: hypothetical protein VNC78_02855 [Actinomycetota bacterium]|nr:hypothetical protein [Actinomycetota bacterium]